MRPIKFTFMVDDESDLTFDESPWHHAREQLIDHVRCLIAKRAGDVASTRELWRLRGRPDWADYNETAPKLIEIYHRMIEWAEQAHPGDMFSENFGGQLRIFCHF